MDDATRAQTRAADPATSTWLGANAGSGKTRVLTDRVARLLLDGVRPERILCLTYTKAAAMEMQNRLFKTLGTWAMKDDSALRKALADIGVWEVSLTDESLSRARTLFARAIEAPGGLKIQTIHSFCASVLRRFPLEARVSPAFTEIDDRVQARLIADLLDEMAEGDKGREALDLVAAHLSDDDGAVALAKAVAGQAEELTPPADWAEISAGAGIDPGLTEAEIIAGVLIGGEADLATVVCQLLDMTNPQHVSLHVRLGSVCWDAPKLGDLETLEAAFLVQSGPKMHQPRIDGIANAAVRKLIGEHMEPLNDLMQRTADARPLRTGLLTARRTHALHQFAATFLPAYVDAKEARGWLDFDDLIDKTRALLTNKSVAQWVLFRLDGGIDHILVDEAQDTSPRQWDIVERLAEDFAAGDGARAEVKRTIFVVGDKKQSIYSFQGADPREFDRMRAHFKARLEEIAAPFQDADLIHSFRSAAPILMLVDAVAARLGAPGLGDRIEHKAFFDIKPGRVDLWPEIEPTKGGAKPEWDDPSDLVSDDHHFSVLAKTLAARIADMLKNPPAIDGRALDAGDILILVQRRSPLFHMIISELKSAGLPVAGVDRSQLTSPLAVKDLLALCRFLATPEDDLSLACLLRSPLCGLSEGDLYDLAAQRPPKGYLWPSLRDRADTHPDTVALLKDLLKQADFLRPYDLLERVLVRHDGRRRMIARLGPEAEDAMDAMLAQALAYEATEVPSLTGFVGWLESGDVQVKRDLSQAAGEIRVMTVHGAKGLEAPVVILPDCAQRRVGNTGIRLIRPEGGPLAWPPAANDKTDAILQAEVERKDRAEEEANRLLYVALTRAASWLIVAAAGSLGGKDNAASSWHKIVRDAMETLPATPLIVPGLENAGLRLQTGDWVTMRKPDDRTETATALPPWASVPATMPVKDEPALSPSDLGGAKALPGPGEDTATAMRRGTIIHLLLEHLPRLPAAVWPAAAAGIAALEAEIDDATLAPLLAEATAVLTAPHLAHLFRPETLAEVEITGRSPTLDRDILGTIDRLLVTPTRITAIDFKTNAIAPGDAKDTPEGLLRQMGAYADLLQLVYPSHEIAVAILWSRTATLMELPHDLVSAALVRARGA